ncbi:esterase FE4-like isoform X2 [Belonocnema kinseyi]|uniref:esterase FE4-like isoform X2 n=1 Tax=Belonocnema kinseyi TaxID=2817044 RepID=UPI00143DE5DB|nr:esterase FE4-like isoform X2 [Belonocnema kinseyi]
MNIQIWIPFSLAIFRAPYVAWFSVTPQVIISQGVLTGTTLETRLGRYFSKFSGLPYGQPPVGDLRFSSPIPAKGWDGVLSADKDNIMCPQFSGSEVVGQEDCLYLNVYAPLREFSSTIASKSKRSSLFPVIVFVPGGAYAFGSNSPSSFGPHYLLDKDIILVTINYRIGIFGFLTTGDLIAPGNYGLKDQVLALKWVQQNIESFGGDPKKITLMGSSSGAGAVSLHSLSHSSIGLFNQYIFQSGSALCPWNYRRKEDFKPDIRKMAKNVDCVTEDSKDLIKCLREINFEALLTATKSVKSALDELPWRPTDELESEEAFLTDSPLNLIAQNKMKDLPFICGTVSNEGIYYTKELYSNPSSTAIHTFYNNLPNKNECIKDYYFKESILTKNEATETKI